VSTEIAVLTIVELHMACNLNCVVETEVSGLQATMYTINVVIVWNQCKIGMLLLQTTNRKCYMAYQIRQILMTLSDL